ncbi:MAG: hypothetical protein KIT69_21310 [Propionibacteriaceae bacterium]|nr:hypothetical protein [Propionibacteriaceae bacterium]
MKFSDFSFQVQSSKRFRDSGRDVRAFLVKACVNDSSEPQTFSYMRWTAVGPDSERFEPTRWSDIQPSFPSGLDDSDEVKPGDCVKGYIQFEPDVKLTELRYANDRGDSATFDLATKK